LRGFVDEWIAKWPPGIELQPEISTPFSRLAQVEEPGLRGGEAGGGGGLRSAIPGAHGFLGDGKMGSFFNWLKVHDLPNWFTFLFSLFGWPLLVYWWNTHKVQGIPHLEVLPQKADITINGQAFPAVHLVFTNRTGRVVYLSRTRLRERQKNFPIPVAAGRDISGGWRELKFAKNNTGSFIHDECILQTGDRLTTTVPVSRPMDQAFYSYRPSWLSRCLRWQKYFRLQYTAMVGEKKYSVQTVY
jgi:hypothetical protein